jgi:hypothetical protein
VFVGVVSQGQRPVCHFYIGAPTAGGDSKHAVGTGAVVVRRHCVWWLHG